MLQDIHKRALRRAAEIAGGNDELRVYLGVSEVEFASWVGKHDLPRDIFLRLVDIITREPRANVRSRSPMSSKARLPLQPSQPAGGTTAKPRGPTTPT